MLVHKTVLWICNLLVLFSIVLAEREKNEKNQKRGNLKKFPHDFKFGVATSAYQIEGAWNVDGKGPNIWDTFTHKNPSPIYHNDTGDVACNSYYKYKEDVALAASLGSRYYRFSFSLARILPTGYTDEINEKGIQYYKNLTQEILKYNMIPLATLYHWDLQQKLMDDGIDWLNPAIIDVMTNYSRLVIERFPEVGMWITINEPKQVCHMSYGLGLLAPGITSSGVAEYQCAYVVLKTHAAIYHMYKKFFPHYKAKMTMVIDCQWIEAQTNSTADEVAADRQRQFECGLYFHPLHVGDWPSVVKQRVASRSLAANLTKSRLPDFTAEEIKFIKGTYDFMALNHYFSILASDSIESPANVTSYEADLGVTSSFNPAWVIQNNGFFTIVPYGVRKVLNWLKEQYGDEEIIITEIGMTEDGSTLNDTIRIDFFHDYFCNILAAMYIDNVRVTGITAWSLIDNFEWASGYSAHFGFYYIDFYNDPSRKRVPKESVKFFQELTKTKKLSCDGPSREWLGPVAFDKKGKPFKGKGGKPIKIKKN